MNASCTAGVCAAFYRMPVVAFGTHAERNLDVLGDQPTLKFLLAVLDQLTRAEGLAVVAAVRCAFLSGLRKEFLVKHG